MKINKYEIARKLGVSHQAVYKWFNGKCMPRSDKLLRLSKLLDISPEKLLRMIKKDI